MVFAALDFLFLAATQERKPRRRLWSTGTPACAFLAKEPWLFESIRVLDNLGQAAYLAVMKGRQRFRKKKSLARPWWDTKSRPGFRCYPVCTIAFY